MHNEAGTLVDDLMICGMDKGVLHSFNQITSGVAARERFIRSSS